MNRHKHIKESNRTTTTNFVIPLLNSSPYTIRKTKVRLLDHDDLDEDQGDNFHEQNQKKQIEYSTKPSLHPKEIRQAFEGLKCIATHMKLEDEEKKIKEEWKYVALVIDRLFLYIFTAACVAGTFGIILQAPSIYDYRKAIDADKSSRF